MRRARVPVLVTLALSLGLVASACGESPPAAGGGDQQEDQGEGRQEQGDVTIAGRLATNHGSEDVAGASETEVELDDFYFGPTVLEGDAGQQLTLTLFNEGDAPHTFTIDELRIDEELEPGTTDVTVEVTFPDSGALPFYCRFHESGGMVGGLSVGGDLEAAQVGGSMGEEMESGPGYGR
jgi:plastocyanin